MIATNDLPNEDKHVLQESELVQANMDGLSLEPILQSQLCTLEPPFK